MPDHILLDTNIILDLLSARTPFSDEAKSLFTLVEKGRIQAYVSALTIANVYYIMSRHLKNEEEVRRVIRKLLLLVKPLELDEKIIRLALESEFKDMEDAIQYYTALENGLQIVITRNLKDFRQSTLPVMTAGDYIRAIADDAAGH